MPEDHDHDYDSAESGQRSAREAGKATAAIIVIGVVDRWLIGVRYLLSKIGITCHSCQLYGVPQVSHDSG